MDFFYNLGARRDILSSLIWVQTDNQHPTKAALSRHQDMYKVFNLLYLCSYLVVLEAKILV